MIRQLEKLRREAAQTGLDLLHRGDAEGAAAWVAHAVRIGEVIAEREAELLSHYEAELS